MKYFILIILAISVVAYNFSSENRKRFKMTSAITQKNGITEVSKVNLAKIVSKKKDFALNADEEKKISFDAPEQTEENAMMLEARISEDPSIKYKPDINTHEMQIVRTQIESQLKRKIR